MTHDEQADADAAWELDPARYARLIADAAAREVVR